MGWSGRAVSLLVSRLGGWWLVVAGGRGRGGKGVFFFGTSPRIFLVVRLYSRFDVIFYEYVTFLFSTPSHDTLRGCQKKSLFWHADFIALFQTFP